MKMKDSGEGGEEGVNEGGEGLNDLRMVVKVE